MSCAALKASDRLCEKRAIDGTVSFAFATQDGDVIARLAIDERTGRIRRVG